MMKNHLSNAPEQQLEVYAQLARGLRKTLPLTLGSAFLASLSPATVSAQICSESFGSFILVPGSPEAAFDFDQDGGSPEIRLRVNNGAMKNAYHRFGSAMLSTMRTINGRPQRLAAGNVISDLQTAMKPRANTGFFTRTTYGNWLNAASNGPITGYFGFSFVDFNGDRHYGWMQLEIKDNREVGNIAVDPYIKVLGWGYNTQPNASITAGQTSPSGSCLVLPVELASFSAVPKKESILLQWRTETETNNAGFELQRSENGHSFHSLQFLEGAGTTREPQEYIFEDNTAQKGQSYFYRLKQLDIDGTFQYSNIIRAALQGDKPVLDKIYPNPVSSNRSVQVPLFLPQAGEIILALFDARGGMVQTVQHTLEAGTHTLTLPVQGLSSGAYFVKVTANGESVYQTLVVNP